MAGNLFFFPDGKLLLAQTDGDFTFFAKNTFSKECALLGYNFHARLRSVLPKTEAGGDERVAVISVLYLFYKYQLHHGDIALNLATCVVYLEELAIDRLQEFVNRKSNGLFNIILYTAFLSHAWNDDVTIRLRDWYCDVGRIYFKSIKDMNAYIWTLWSELFNFNLNIHPSKVRRVIRTLCALPSAAPTVRFNPE